MIKKWTFNIPAQTQVSAYSIPSYNNYTNISSPYTAASDGWVIISFYHSSSGSNTLTVKVNNVEMGGFQSHDYDNQNLSLNLHVGDVLTYSGSNIRFAKFCGNRYVSKYSSTMKQCIKY